MTFVIAFYFTLMLVLALILVPFMTFHYVLVFRGKTTIEFFTWDSSENRRFIYDFGLWKNWVAVMNYNPFLWWVPVNANTRGRGVFFNPKEINEHQAMLAMPLETPQLAE